MVYLKTTSKKRGCPFGQPLFFERDRTPLRALLPLAAATRAEREEFFGTRVSRQKTIKIICRLRAANGAK